ncbi:MAG: PDZ domain-containing protein [Gemmataceae bacterium]
MTGRPFLLPLAALFLAPLSAEPSPVEAIRKAAPPAKPGPSLPADWTKAFAWRCVGPASMGGRIVALAVVESDPSTYWIATASGGLLKTTNNGTTFEHQFDREATVSIGDVAVAPSNRDIVWVGTGENNPRNSVSYGDGVYKSTDGGKTWTNMGLRRTFQIGRIAIHPTNPEIVYVGALGRLYGPNEERGLFKTTDGGKTWKKILHVDEKTGVIDVRLHPTQPDTLLAATWERRRDGFDSHAGALAAGPAGKVDPPVADGYDAYDPVTKWGKGGGIWKTTDGGATFKRLTAGLPTNAMGRIGLDYYRKDPNIVFAIIDCERIGMGRVPGYLGVTPKDDRGGVRVAEVTKDSPAQAGGVKAGDLITAIDGEAMKDAATLSRAVQRHKPDDKVTVTVGRGDRTLTLAVTLGQSPDLPSRRGPMLGIKGVDTPSGVRVEGLLPGGIAAGAGVQAKDVVVALGGQKVKTIKELSDAFRAAKPGGTVVLQVQRGNTTKELKLTAPDRGRPGRPYGLFLGGQRENVQDMQGPDGHEYGGLYRSADGGETWKRINSVNPRPMYFSQVRVDPSDEKQLYVLGIRLYRSEDGGKTFKAGGDSGVHADHHALWINPRDGRHLLIGTDGGTYVSYDRGARWDFLNNTAIGQFYHAALDSRQPYRIYGGMQDNGSWAGRAAARRPRADQRRLGDGAGGDSPVASTRATRTSCTANRRRAT